MSDDTEDESTDGSGQQPAEGDQPSAEEQPVEQTDQSTEQSEEQPTENDQPADQAEEQPAGGEQASDQSSSEDQPTEQSQEQATDSDQTADQPPDISKSATPDSADDAVAPAGRGGSPAAGGGGSHKLKVIAEFTEEGKPFIGDIKILLFDYDKNGVSSQVWDQGNWQDTTTKGNVVTTPLVRFTTSEVAITADARLIYGTGSFQVIGSEFVFPMPSGDTLRTKFEIEIGKVDETVTAPDDDHAKGKVFQMPKFKGKFVSLDAQSIGNQQFRVTGKYATGTVSSSDGRRL
jgi:hypothetical protein